MIMLYSTVSYTAQLKHETPTEHLANQILATVLGFVGMIILSFIDYHKYEKPRLAPAVEEEAGEKRSRVFEPAGG